MLSNGDSARLCPAEHPRRQRVHADGLLLGIWPLPGCPLHHHDLVVSRDGFKEVVAQIVLQREVFTAVVAAARVAARVRVTRARSGEQRGWPLGDPRVVGCPMAPLGLAMRPARAIISGRGTVETVVVAHLGISHDLLELPQRQHPSRDLGDRRTRLSSASNAVDKGSAGVRQVRSPTHQAVHRPVRHAETPPICGPDPCLVAVVAISQATPWLNWEGDPTRFSGRAPKFSLERSIRNVCRISAVSQYCDGFF